MSEEQRPFHAIVWIAGGSSQERVELTASSYEYAATLLRETYGPDCEFQLTDVQAANQRR
jgi:hypothetical protein